MSIASPARSRRALGRLRPTLRAAVVLAVVLLILAGGWLWLRRSALVSVQEVNVTGLSGPSVGAIRGALERSALTMTTLDVDMAVLERAVRRYPVVRSLSVTRHLPHTLTIAVHEQVPVARAVIAGRQLVVTASGQLLPGTSGSSRLPELVAPLPPDDGRLIDSGDRAVLAVLGHAPYGFLRHVTRAGHTAARGVVLTLRSGPELIFGPAFGARDKWAAALAVLADPASQGASYINVSDPNRAAAGVS